MKFLANENSPLAGISLFREAGYDVAAVIEDRREQKTLTFWLEPIAKSGSSSPLTVITEN